MAPGKAWKEAFAAMRDDEDKVAVALVEPVLQTNKAEASSGKDDYRDHGQQNGWTLLHQAASLHQLKCVEVLLKTIKKEAIDATTHAGQTPLHLAAQRDDVDVCEMLMLAGADPAKKNNAGYDPRRQAKRHGSELAVAYLEAAADAKEKFGLNSDPFKNARRILEEAAAAIVERQKQDVTRERARANEGVPKWASLRTAVHLNHSRAADEVTICVCGGGTAGPGGGPGPGGVDCSECGAFRLDLTESQRQAGLGHGKFRFFTKVGEPVEHV